MEGADNGAKGAGVLTAASPLPSGLTLTTEYWIGTEESIVLNNEQWLKDYGLNWNPSIIDIGTLQLTDHVSFKVSRGVMYYSVYYKTHTSYGQVDFKSEKACKDYLEHQISFKVELRRLTEKSKKLEARITPLSKKLQATNSGLAAIIFSGR